MNAPVVEVTLCGAESAFLTVTFVPAFTVSGAPNLKFLIVIVAAAVVPPCDFDGAADGDDEGEDDDDGEDELDEEPDEEQAAAIVSVNAATATRRSALITQRYG